ncbi:16S rRNA (cytosine(1402)-N(4))-methyltransferase RsmH [Nitrosomonas oligotropha]|uniref:16S rRNA (cytosine(1402)-N(4))-methyltransferase RsmH n=1 Tax=Nitrosomonas oligotropha TaxID=42354 RepID=UPI00136817D1|nr:16S rRNA (cytosine(1402)-N(4))-methyltransferase RsmH [Nitrosomonas oligotropha]MXS81871.1 16S rRNA (cytosine(1402)-N(4))-methyltransferase RsmH [Nitrosomonas oligotropha]
MHISVLLHEAVDALAIKPEGVYVDATFGRGGHSRLILSRLGEHGRLIALDRDPVAVKSGEAIEDKRFCIRHGSFSQLRQIVQELGIAKIDGVLLDLGVSSPQLEEISRGFSFRADGPLDMRMDTTKGQTAAEWLATATEDQLGWVIKEYGEERFARQIARAIIVARARQPIVTTSQLAEIVAAVLRSRQRQREIIRHPATRTFQAIRIYLNQELEELSLVLPQCVELLNPGGRLVVISFHSLEDRMVKLFMRKASSMDELPRGVPLQEKDLLRFSNQTLRVIGRAVRPGEQEVADNARARSAVMRVAERVTING